jgi:hypothetical protein
MKAPCRSNRLNLSSEWGGCRVDITQGELAESHLDALIERRDRERRKTEGERAEEVLWAESERRYFAKQREQNPWEWVRFYDRMAASLRARAEEYDQRAAALVPTNGHEEGA